MSNFAENQTKKIITNALKRLAEKGGKQPSQTQIILALDKKDSDLLKYKLLYDYVPAANGYEFADKKTGEIPYCEILGMKIDMLGTETVACQFLTPAIKEYAEENGCDKNEIEIMILTRDDNAATPEFSLYAKGEFVQYLDLKEIFSEQKN